jgi:hypothetical protein
MVERFHRTLKNALRARCSGIDWSGHLPWVMLGLRAVPKEDCGISSAEMVFGTPLTLPGEFIENLSPGAGSGHGQTFFESLTEKMKNLPPIPTRRVSDEQRRDKVPDTLKNANFVFLRRDGHVPPLTPLYEGPFRVVSRTNKTFTLLRGVRQETVSVDRLKPYLGGDEPQVAVPPARGRPRKPPE